MNSNWTRYLERLETITSRFKDVEFKMSDPESMKDIGRYRELTQEYANLKAIVDEFDLLKRADEEIEGARDVLSGTEDPELQMLAQEELDTLEDARHQSTERIKLLLLPKDPLEDRNIMMEIRAGTGGDEATLFVADLFRMYSRFAESRGWTVEIMTGHGTEIGGFKEVVFSVQGNGPFEDLRFESGVHRVQRVPVTESSGRVHTSAVTVAVLPEVEATEIEIKSEDLRVDVFRSSGPGGQSVNTTDSAVRLTHLPTGLVVSCQDEKSQHKNKARAIRVLRARLFELEESRKQRERAEERKSQIGSGDRSLRIRTYNFPQNRVTDHRINLTLYKLEEVLLGSLDDFIGALKARFQEERLLSLDAIAP